MNVSPTISIIIPTYNRAHTLNRAIDSILNQTFQDFEIIIVDDGSTDHTNDVLSRYHDKRIKILRHQKNRGVTAAINTGFDNIKGEWFTLLGSDDEIAPDAFQTFLDIPKQIDASIDAITCNCMDSIRKSFSGKGLFKDQFLDEKTIAAQCEGEFWGLTKTSLLGDMRFNERLPGFENTLWYKINEKARRYYIHKGLRIYHTEGEDRISTFNFRSRYHTKDYLYAIYKELKNEPFYLKKIRDFAPDRFFRMSLNGFLVCIAKNDKETAHFYYDLLKNHKSVFVKTILYLPYHAGPVIGNILFTIFKYLKLIRYRVQNKTV